MLRIKISLIIKKSGNFPLFLLKGDKYISYIIKIIIINMEENTVDNIQTIDADEIVQSQESPTPDESATDKEVTILPYQFIFDAIYTNAKSLGQVVFVDANSVEGSTSNTISVIRMLSSGEKQFFTITVNENSQLTLKK